MIRGLGDGGDGGYDAGDSYGFGSYRHDPLPIAAEAPPQNDHPAIMDFTPQHFAASLADAMAGQGDAFPRYYVSMVRAGEAGGSLEVVLARLADYLENAEAVRARVQASLRYPLILLAMTGLSIAVSAGTSATVVSSR